MVKTYEQLEDENRQMREALLRIADPANREGFVGSAQLYDVPPENIAQEALSYCMESHGSSGKGLIHELPNYELTEPLVVKLVDDGAFLAKVSGLSMLYGFGYTPDAALDMLKREIENLYEDLLNTDDIGTQEYLDARGFLKSVVKE